MAGLAPGVCARAGRAAGTPRPRSWSTSTSPTRTCRGATPPRLAGATGCRPGSSCSSAPPRSSRSTGPAASCGPRLCSSRTTSPSPTGGRTCRMTAGPHLPAGLARAGWSRAGIRRGSGAGLRRRRRAAWDLAAGAAAGALPVLHWWRFWTGEAGDFETLAFKIMPRPARAGEGAAGLPPGPGGRGAGGPRRDHLARSDPDGPPRPPPAPTWPPSSPRRRAHGPTRSAGTWSVCPTTARPGWPTPAPPGPRRSTPTPASGAPPAWAVDGRGGPGRAGRGGRPAAGRWAWPRT